MTLLSKFWKWLTTATRRSPKKGHPDLYPIDVDKLAEELSLAEEAKRLGEGGLPSTDATTISGPEAAIVQRVEKARQDYVDWAVLRLSVLSEELGRRNITQEVNRASQADKEFERKASALLTEQDGLLRNLGHIAMKRKSELEEFKRAHGLSREANYPSATGTFFRYSLLLVLIVVEGILNASFFSQGLDSGLLGGFSYAVALALLNVALAFAFGKFAIPYVFHSRVPQKLFGVVALAFALSIMASVGIGIAHFRDSLTAEAIEPARVALQTLVASPFSLRDFFSWALFFISIAFGLAALFDGLSSDDYYPGYGRISRRTQTAIDDYEDELNAMRNQLEELKDEELKSLDSVVQQSQASVQVSSALIADKRSAGSRLSTAMRDADHSLDALLSKFRTENQLHRNGVKRPSYFDEGIELRHLQIPDFSTKNDEIVLAEQEKLVNALLASVEEIRARIQAAFNQQFDRVRTLDSHFSSQGGG